MPEMWSILVPSNIWMYPYRLKLIGLKVKVRDLVVLLEMVPNVPALTGVFN